MFFVSSLNWRGRMTSKKGKWVNHKSVKIVDGQPWDPSQPWFQVTYEETTLFLMAVTSVLLVYFEPEVRSDVSYAFENSGVDLFFWIFFAGGVLLALIHPFLRRSKTNFEKTVMLLFLLAANGGSGLYAGFLLIAQTDHRYLIFPLINIFSFFFISISRVAADYQRAISDKDATLSDVFISTIFLLLVFTYCEIVLKTHWAITFSICVAYATLLRSLLQKLFESIKKLSYW